MKRILAVGALCATTACSTPTWNTPEVQQDELSWARTQFIRASLPPSRNTPTDDIVDVTRRVQERVTQAAYRVCTRMYATGCEVVTKHPVVVAYRSPEVNAYVDANNQITVLGGLVRAVGSDDELAAVIAHEYAHVMIGHVHQMQSNAGLGALTGALAGMAIGYGLHTPGSTVIEDMGAAGYDIGRSTGGLMFTKEMEREADHVGAYILHEAGYELEAGRNLWIRLAREARSGTPLGLRSMRGYFRTHPSTEERYIAWEKSTKEVRSGHQRPLTREERIRLGHEAMNECVKDLTWKQVLFENHCEHAYRGPRPPPG